MRLDRAADHHLLPSRRAARRGHGAASAWSSGTFSFAFARSATTLRSGLAISQKGIKRPLIDEPFSSPQLSAQQPTSPHQLANVTDGVTASPCSFSARNAAGEMK
jgi:hypothetical protein